MDHAGLSPLQLPLKVPTLLQATPSSNSQSSNSWTASQMLVVATVATMAQPSLTLRKTSSCLRPIFHTPPKMVPVMMLLWHQLDWFNSPATQVLHPRASPNSRLPLTSSQSVLLSRPPAHRSSSTKEASSPKIAASHWTMPSPPSATAATEKMVQAKTTSSSETPGAKHGV